MDGKGSHIPVCHRFNFFFTNNPSILFFLGGGLREGGYFGGSNCDECHTVLPCDLSII